MRSVRMSLPQYITNITSFKDTVKILKNKGILNEAIINSSSIESLLKSYLAKGYSYSEAIRAVAAEEGIDEDILSSQYPQDVIDIEGHEDEDEDAEFADMIARAEDELSPEKYKFQDFPEKNISEDDDEEEAPEDYEDPDMFDAYGMDASEGKIREAKKIKISGGIVKKFKQNGDKSYSVEFEDGSKRTIAVSNDDWDIIKAADKEIPGFESTRDSLNSLSIREAKEIKGSSGKEQYSKFNEAENDNLQELTTGIDIEHECFPEKTYEEIEKIVLKNIKKIPLYYTNYKLTGIRGYEPQTMDASKPETHQMKFVKGEDSYVDKARIMKPVKGVEKAKASSNKANKETNKIVKGVEELTHFAQTVRGLQKFASTGGKMKTIKLKEEIDPEIEGKPSQAYLDFLAGKKQGEKIMQAKNNKGQLFSVNDIVVAPDGKKIKITGFTTGKDGKMKAMYNAGMFADVYNLDDLEKKPSFRPGVDLGKYNLKSMLEKMVREVLDEIYDGGDDMSPQYAQDEITENDGSQEIEKKINTGEIDPAKVKAAAEKAMKGDSTDLALLMAFGK